MDYTEPEPVADIAYEIEAAINRYAFEQTTEIIHIRIPHVARDFLDTGFGLEKVLLRSVNAHVNEIFDGSQSNLVLEQTGQIAGAAMVSLGQVFGCNWFTIVIVNVVDCLRNNIGSAAFLFGRYLNLLPHDLVYQWEKGGLCL